MTADATPRDFYVTAPLIWPLLLGLRFKGIAVEKLLDAVGLPRKMLLDPETRISPERVLRLVECAVELTEDEDLGIHLAELYEPGVFGTLDYLAHSAQTLRESVEILCRYERIHQNGMITTLEVDGARALVRHRMLHPYVVPRQVSENTLANLLVIGRKLTGLAFVPQEIWLAHPKPARTKEQERLFGCPIRWGAPQDIIFIATSLLDVPLLKASPRLASVLGQHAEQLLQNLCTDAAFSSRARERMSAELARGVVSLERVAEQLDLNGRTLQRRLREEGTSFGALLQELRYQSAQQHLQNTELGMEDIALMLGFADTRSFRRSFRRWAGKSPADYRRSAG